MSMRALHYTGSSFNADEYSNDTHGVTVTRSSYTGLDKARRRDCHIVVRKYLGPWGGEEIADFTHRLRQVASKPLPDDTVTRIVRNHLKETR